MSCQPLCCAGTIIDLGHSGEAGQQLLNRSDKSVETHCHEAKIGEGADPLAVQISGRNEESSQALQRSIPASNLRPNHSTRSPCSRETPSFFFEAKLDGVSVCSKI